MLWITGMGDYHTEGETVFRTMSELWEKRLTLVKYLWRERRDRRIPLRNVSAQIQRVSREASVDAGGKRRSREKLF